MTPWSNSDVLVGSGILILPNMSSTGLLIGAVFLQGAFPNILFSASPRPRDAIPSGLAIAQPFTSVMVSSSSHSQSATRQNVPQGASAHDDSTQSLMNQRLMQSGFHYHSSIPKAYSDEPLSPTMVLRQTLAGAVLDPFLLDDTTDGSGCTSPGSTRTW